MPFNQEEESTVGIEVDPLKFDVNLDQVINWGLIKEEKLKSGFRKQVAKLITHVQYTQTDTIRQTDGPLVPMVGLVPIEKDVIPMVLLVNMHLIKGT